MPRKQRDLKSYPKAWEKFFNLLASYTDATPANYTHYQLLGYAVSKTNIEIQISDFNNDGLDPDYAYTDKKKNCPSHCPELEVCRKWIRKFGSAQEAYNYFNYCLTHSKSSNITSLNYFNTTKSFYLYSNRSKPKPAKTITRSTQLPDNLKQLLHITNYGELSLCIQCIPETREQLLTVGLTEEEIYHIEKKVV